jgi:hypothetical protein
MFISEKETNKHHDNTTDIGTIEEHPHIDCRCSNWCWIIVRRMDGV